MEHNVLSMMTHRFSTSHCIDMKEAGFIRVVRLGAWNLVEKAQDLDSKFSKPDYNFDRLHKFHLTVLSISLGPRKAWGTQIIFTHSRRLSCR
jgi:hypothetical protein